MQSHLHNGVVLFFYFLLLFVFSLVPRKINLVIVSYFPYYVFLLLHVILDKVLDRLFSIHTL